MNKYQPHVLVLPEDDANRQLANGFLLDEFLKVQCIQVLEEVGGWIQVLERFKSDHVHGMERYQSRYMVLLIDFDCKQDRLNYAKRFIPAHLADRVFILGVWTEPEELGGKLEGIGAALAKDCREGTSKSWDHRLLGHNAGEVARLRERVRPFLF
jgi:hypothetical protein